MPSAAGCSNPNGPTRVGPQRFCMCPTTFRSNQTVYATAVSRTKSVSADLITETRMKVPMLNDCYPFSTDLRRETFVNFRPNLPVRYRPESPVRVEDNI